MSIETFSQNLIEVGSSDMVLFGGLCHEGHSGPAVIDKI